MKTKKNFLIKKSISIKDAILKLKETGMKCLIITDTKNRLLGTLTDGDMRDIIVKKIDLNKSINNFFNKNPKFIKRENYSNEAAKKIFEKYRIETIPIVENNEVVDVISWSDIFLKKNSLKNISVIIIAGGRGERLNPFTKVLPKPLVPVYEKTIIDFIIDQFKPYDINNFTFTLNYKANLIKTYLKNNIKKNKYYFHNEKNPLGTIGSLSLLNEKKISKNFFVTNCDILIKSDFKKIYDFHMKKNNDVTIVTCYQKYKIPYGTCIAKKDGTLKSLVEKPETYHLINTGFYVMNKKILKHIPKNTHLDFNEFVQNLLKKKMKIGIYPIDMNSWTDVGTWSEYKKNLNFSF